jgi:hypothetical protein
MDLVDDMDAEEDTGALGLPASASMSSTSAKELT